jgi:acetyl esterase
MSSERRKRATVRERPVPNGQVRAYLASVPATEPALQRDLAAVRREARERALAASGVPEHVASLEELRVDGVAARLYRPTGVERDVLVWLHGGGWIMSDLDCCDAIARALANRAGCAVLSVDYRLAPEHHYPDPVDDSWSAVTWAVERFDRVAIGGESAGGNLAAAVALRARDRGVNLAMQLLVSPVLDWRPDSAAYDAWRQRYAGFAGVDEYGAGFQDGMRYIWDLYVPDPSQRGEPEASPLRAASVAGVAPAMLISAEHDILCEEGEEYADRLRSSGVAVETLSYDGQIHGFFTLLGVMEDARNAVDEAATALRRAFSQ